MEIYQVVIYAVVALYLFLLIRRWIGRRGMKEYSPQQVAELLHDSSVVLLDVRTREERVRGHIQGSLHIPLNEIRENMQLLKKYSTKEIICYCHSGSRSWLAAAELKEQGFNAVNMGGGIIGWNYLNLKS